MRTDLFRFEEGATVHTFTSGNREVDFNSETYIPIPIGRNAILSTQELGKASIEVSMSMKNTVAQNWVATVLEDPIRLTIYTIVDTDPAVVSWIGRLIAVKATKRDAILVINSDATLLLRGGLRKRYQRTCPYVLYGKGCFIDETSFSVAGVIAARADLTLTIPEAALQPSGFYTGGMIEASDGKRRYITVHTGSTIVISRDLPGLVDLNVNLFAGCDRSRTDCIDRFDNVVNFGGFPFLPLKNPFGGTAII